MRKLFNFNMMMVIMMTLCVHFSSCSKDKDDEGLWRLCEKNADDTDNADFRG